MTGNFPPDASLERWALEQDAADQLAWCRQEFEHPVEGGGHPAYFCGNSLGLMPRATRTLVETELDDWSRLAVEGHHAARTPWYTAHESLRDPLARLVGARPHEVVAMNSLTVNLHLMLATFYQPRPGREGILIEEAAFPSDNYAVASHIRHRGIDPAAAVQVARPRAGESTLRTEDLEALLDRRGGELALVMLGGVHYYSGQLLDMERITRAAQRAGCLVGFDLAHAAGNAPLALHDWNVDFAVWCSYKYLNAGPGAIGGCFVHERHGRNRALNRLAGWWGNDPATRFRMHLNDSFVPVEGADGWQVSNPSILAIAPLRASLGLFDRATMPALRAKSERLTGYLEHLVRSVPGGRVEIITPAQPEARGCQLSLLVRRGGKALFDGLRARGVIGDFREPGVIRLAPVPLYNTFHEVWRAGHALRELALSP